MAAPRSWGWNMATITLKSAVETAGRVSIGNTKMPGSAFALDAFACNVGDRLAKVPGSVCGGCYARKLQKLRPSVDQGWRANQTKSVAAIANDPEAWARMMAFQISAAAKKTGQSFHRWFDSGDLPSVAFLAAVVRVCEMTPTIRHWLPTREAGVVREYAKAGGLVPDNLVIRVSAPMVDDMPLKGWPTVSTVHKRRQPGEGEHICPARQQGNACGDCRACWSREVYSVSYPKH